MKTVTMKVPIDVAKRTLSEFEKQIADRVRQRDELSTEIIQLEESIQALRAELNNGVAEVRPRGTNKEKIKEYLAKIPENKGARASEITKATGIGVSSTAFTLSHYTKDFEKDDDTKRWKLKM